MHKYRNEHVSAAPDGASHHACAWRRVASAMVENPHISAVQLDVGAVTDAASIEAMVATLRLLPKPTSLHVKTLRTQNEAQTLLAIQIVAAVAKRLHDATSRAGGRLVVGQCQYSQSIFVVYYERTAVAMKASSSAGTATRSRSLALERVTIHHRSLWQAVQGLLTARAGDSWREEVRAMNVDRDTWQALSSCTQLLRLTLTHCCVDESFPLLVRPSSCRMPSCFGTGWRLKLVINHLCLPQLPAMRNPPVAVAKTNKGIVRTRIRTR